MNDIYIIIITKTKIYNIFNMKRFYSKLLNKHSKIITNNIQSGPAQAMLYALNLTKKDMNKPQIGIGSVWYESNPCNSHIDTISNRISSKFKNSDMIGFKFNSIGVSDGISMGTKGMQYSLLSRELIADNFETICRAHHYDGLISIPGCDKNLPGVLMAMCRINRPSFIIYGGSMKPNNYNNKELDIVSAFESYGMYLKGDINKNEYQNILENSCNKKCGSCSGLYTANTMASIFEVMGITLPNSSTNPANSIEKMKEADDSYKIIHNLLKKNIRPSDILTKESFINGIKMIFVTGGSTNAIIHLIAISKNIGINITLDDFNKYNNIPVLLNMKPHGKYMMYHLHKIGGMSIFIKYLIDIGIINGNILTITGKTLKENVNDNKFIEEYNNFICNQYCASYPIINYYTETGDLIKSSKEFNYTLPLNIIHTIENPFKNNSHIRILKGNISPKGSISKLYDDKIKIIKGKVKVYYNENDMIKSLNNGEINNNNIILILGQGETVGCPEMLKPTGALVGYFKNNVPPLLTDGRFSGGSKGILVAHLQDIYKKNSLTSIIKNNDIIEIDFNNNKINLLIDEKEIILRKKNVKHYKPKYNGVLYKFSKYSGDIDNGYLIK